MVKQVLSEQQRKFREKEKEIALELQSCLAGFKGAVSENQTLQEIITNLDEFFHLVVMGEFNVGKSSFINILLRGTVVEVDALPAQDRIIKIRFGKQKEERDENGVLVKFYPSDFLQDVCLVDTPGPNTIIDKHEDISKGFIPHSDLILYLMSAKQPFTGKDYEYLKLILEWKIEVVIILNEIDKFIPEELERIKNYILGNCKKRLDFKPRIFGVSIDKAKELINTGNNEMDIWQESGFPKLTADLIDKLRQWEGVRTKLRRPLDEASREVSAGRKKWQCNLPAGRCRAVCEENRAARRSGHRM